MTWTGWRPSAPYHCQAAQGQHLPVQGLGVAADPDGDPLVAGHGGDDDQFGEPVAFDPGAAGPAGAGRRWRVQGGIGAEPGGHGDLGGQAPQGLADVGGVADQVHGLVPEVGDDQVEQLAGQDQRGGVWLAGDPQPGQDRQADRSGDKRQVDDDTDHDPAVAPGGPVAAGSVAVVVPGGAVQFAAAAAPQGIVDGQHHRSDGRDHAGADEVQQDQSE